MLSASVFLGIWPMLVSAIRIRSLGNRILNFLEILPEVLQRYSEPIIIAGDFNQRIPRVKGGHIAAAEAMQVCFEGYDIVSEGTIAGLDRPGIDHIALSSEIECLNVFGWSNIVKGKKVSDHDGAGCEVRLSV